MELISRPILNTIISNLNFEEFTIITGPRQSGKTSVLILLQEFLEDKNLPAYFISLEDPEILAHLNSHPEELISLIPRSDEKVYILIDEIQYLKNPTNFLKYNFDIHRKKFKIICTGSSAFYIDEKFEDSLAGRKQVLNLFTLSFEEFLLFKTGNNKLMAEISEMNSREEYRSLHDKKLNQLLNEYLTFGGYPAVVLAESTERKKMLLVELSQSYVKHDIFESGIKNGEKLFFLLKMLAAQTGSLLNANQFSTILQLSSTAINNYITTLRKTFHIHLMRPFYKNLKKELSKMPKVYFNDLGMRNVLLDQFQDISNRLDKSELIENFVFLQLRNKYDSDKIRFWRTANGNEVDFVVSTNFERGFAIECKFNERTFNPKKQSKFTHEYPNFPLQVKAYLNSKNSTSLFSI